MIQTNDTIGWPDLEGFSTGIPICNIDFNIGRPIIDLPFPYNKESIAFIRSLAHDNEEDEQWGYFETEEEFLAYQEHMDSQEFDILVQNRQN